MLPAFINLTPVQLNPALISTTLCGNIRVQSESEHGRNHSIQNW